MGERAYGDDVDTGGGDLWNACEGDAAAGFDESATGDLFYGGGELRGGEVVEEDGVGAGGEDGFDLVGAVDFYFDVGSVGEFVAEGLQGVGEVGAGGGDDGEVVVLCHDSV